MADSPTAFDILAALAAMPEKSLLDALPAETTDLATFEAMHTARRVYRTWQGYAAEMERPHAGGPYTMGIQTGGAVYYTTAVTPQMPYPHLVGVTEPAFVDDDTGAPFFMVPAHAARPVTATVPDPWLPALAAMHAGAVLLFESAAAVYRAHGAGLRIGEARRWYGRADRFREEAKTARQALGDVPDVWRLRVGVVLEAPAKGNAGTPYAVRLRGTADN